MILDGKIVDSDRCHEKTLSRKGREIDLWYSGEKKDFGGNIQALFYPGRPADVGLRTCCRATSMTWPRHGRMSCRCCGLSSARMPWPWPTAEYEGAGHGILTPVKKPTGVKELDINARAPGMRCSGPARCLGERGFALLSQRWKTLQHVTASPAEIGPIARAASRRGAIRAQDDSRESR